MSQVVSGERTQYFCVGTKGRGAIVLRVLVYLCESQGEKLEFLCEQRDVFVNDGKTKKKRNEKSPDLFFL